MTRHTARPPVRRRPGALPGRRFAYALLLAAALAATGGGAGTAAADQTVVSATIFPSGHGSVTTRSVGQTALGACPPYSGPNPLTLFPTGQSYNLPATTWTVATVISCGLQIPLTDVSSVQISNTLIGAFEGLSAAALSESSLYDDPGGPGALPIVSVDGSGGQTNYFRPRAVGSNSTVDVTETPIPIRVYAYGPPLTVKAAYQKLTSTVKLSATVTTAAGAVVPASALGWKWDFGDGQTSTQATPGHRFAAGNSYSVTVTVTDPSAGTGGTDTIQVMPPVAPKPSHKQQMGGSKRDKSTSPNGADNGKRSRGPTTPPQPGTNGTQPPATDTQPTGTNTQPAGTNTQPAGTATQPATTATQPATTATQPSTTTAATTATRSTTTGAASTTAAPRRRHSARPQLTPSAPLVTGRLISDVTPLSPSASPLTRPAPAAAAAPAAVRQATRTSALPIVLAPLAIILLLGLGAGRELRGRRPRRSGSAGD